MMRERPSERERPAESKKCPEQREGENWLLGNRGEQAEDEARAGGGD